MDKKIDTKKLGKQLIKIAEDEALRQSLLFRTDGLIKDKGSDASLDIENEKIQLIGGAEITINGLRQYIKSRAQKYEPKFKLEYFEQIFRLNGWPVEEAKNYIKPQEVALYNNEIIYGRFPKEILPALETVNPYWRFASRMFKHHQFLTPEASQQLEVFINDSIRVMKTCDTWHEFKMKYTKEFGLPFQLSLFEKNRAN